MIGLIHTLKSLFDPRGRADRQGLLVAAIVAAILEGFLIAGPLTQSADWVSPTILLKAVVIWICCASVIKRLHDMDLSGWWLPGSLALACMWTAIVAAFAMLTAGTAVLHAGHPGAVIVMGLVILPVLGATLWLHLAPGTTVSNRFGASAHQRLASEPMTDIATALCK